MTDVSALITSEVSDIEIDTTYGQNEFSQHKKFSALIKKFFLKTKFVFSRITVEPCLLFYLFSYAIQSTLITNMIFKKACDVHFEFDKDVCANLTAHPQESMQVQTYSSQLSLYTSLIESLPIVFFILYLGSWSDRNGRKLPLIFPLIGNFLSIIILMVNTLKWDLPPEFILLASVPKALTGGFAALLMICYAYISDISEENDRTMRIAFVDTSFTVGPILGLSCGALMYSKLGFVGAFGLSLSVTLICIIYILIVIKETIVKNYSETLLENEPGANRDRYYVVDALCTALKPRENYLRAKLLTLIVTLSLMVFQYGGLEFLFVKEKFNWSYGTYMNWLIFQIVTASIVTVTFLPIALYKFKIPDLLLGMFGSISRISSLVALAFSPSVFFLYLSIVVGSFGFMPIIVTRAIISKMVSKDEVGKVFLLVACLEVLIPLGSQTMFTLIYNATLAVLPGAIYLVGAAIFFIVAVIFLSIYIIEKKIGCN